VPAGERRLDWRGNKKGKEEDERRLTDKKKGTGEEYEVGKWLEDQGMGGRFGETDRG
jgi:hypothetical protein